MLAQRIVSSSPAEGGGEVCLYSSFVHCSLQMPFGGVTVKDVDSHEFVLALAGYFKKQMV